MKIPRTGLFIAVAMAFTLLLAGPWAAEAQPETVYSISPDDANLRTINPATGATLTSVPITLAGTTVLGGTGLALDLVPGGLLWALLVTTTTPVDTRELVTIDPTPPNCVATCVATSIGNTGGAFAGLAFDGGTLYGVTGEVATPVAASESLFTLNRTTAAPTLACNLGRGAQGEALGFNRDDGLLYHASGVIDTVFETVEEPGVGPLCVITNVVIPPVLQALEVEALGFRPVVGTFFWSQGSTIPTATLYDVTAGGAATLIGSLDHVSKGIAVGPAPPKLDHFACYGALPAGSFPSTVVTLEDQFRSTSMTVTKAINLCNPVNKNGEDPSAPTHPDHLVVYAITQTGSPKFSPVNGLVVTDQFGTLFLDAVTPTSLLVPSAKSLISTPPPPTNPTTDHFVCYTVKTTAGKPPFVRVNGVTVQDQFGTRQVDLTKMSRLCNPVNKNGEDPGADTHLEHLMCYQTAGSMPPFASVDPIFFNNQFGPQQMKATIAGDLCVPALKTPPPIQ